MARSLFTRQDKALLARHAILLDDPRPTPMVSAAKYVEAVDQGDRALTEVFRLRAKRRRWRRRYRAQRRRLVVWQSIALAVSAGLVAALAGRIGW